MILICLFSSVLGLILIYFSAVNIQPSTTKISEIDSRLIGKTVRTTGYIIYRNNHPAGHIFLTIADNQSKIQIPLFSGFVNSLNENDFPVDNLKKGTKIIVTGLVDEYKGQLQIIPRKPEDIKILR
ncbi:MAG: exodeoxyribonuclease VII large subunit [Candidatus Aenigmatarchaeota archaeon]